MSRREQIVSQAIDQMYQYQINRLQYLKEQMIGLIKREEIPSIEDMHIQPNGIFESMIIREQERQIAYLQE